MQDNKLIDLIECRIECDLLYLRRDVAGNSTPATSKKSVEICWYVDMLGQFSSSNSDIVTYGWSTQQLERALLGLSKLLVECSKVRN